MNVRKEEKGEKEEEKVGELTTIFFVHVIFPPVSVWFSFSFCVLKVREVEVIITTVPES